MIEDKEYATRDMNLSACLMAEGIRYLRVERDATDGRRLIFVFDKVGREADIDRITKERANSTHIVSSTVYDDKLRALKTIIHSV
jgi:hypothetical protein